MKLNTPPPPRTPNPVPGSETAIERHARERRAERARSRLNAAFADKVAGNDAGARSALEEAVRLDPNLTMDASAASLASAVYGVTPERAPALLHELSLKDPPVEHYRPDLAVSFLAIQTGIEAALLFLVCAVFATLAYLLVVRLAAEAGSRVPMVARDDVSAMYRTLNGAIFRSITGSGVQWWLAVMAALFSAYWVGTAMGGVGSIGRFMRLADRVLLVSFAAQIAGLTITLGNIAGNASPSVTILGLIITYSAFGLSFIGVTGLTMIVHRLSVGRAVLATFIGYVVLSLGVVIFGLLR